MLALCRPRPNGFPPPLSSSLKRGVNILSAWVGRYVLKLEGSLDHFRCHLNGHHARKIGFIHGISERDQKPERTVIVNPANKTGSQSPRGDVAFVGVNRGYIAGEPVRQRIQNRFCPRRRIGHKTINRDEPTSRGFLLQRFADAGPESGAAVVMVGIRNPSWERT